MFNGGIRNRIRAALGGAAPGADAHAPLIAPEPPLLCDGKLLSGKNVLITGAGRNIGKNIALEMATQGANVYFTDVEATRCSALEKELRSAQHCAKGFVSDVTSRGDNDSLAGFLAANGIVPDILVNNVGTDADDFLTTYRTNVFGPAHLTDLISKLMIEKKVAGSILFITSIHQETVRGSIGYSSSKAALPMIIKELAMKLAPQGIRVNGIAPGYVAEDPRGAPVPHKYTPLHGTSVHPRYIGRAAVYLASDYFSRYTTGATLTIDGALSLVNYFSTMGYTR